MVEDGWGTGLRDPTIPLLIFGSTHSANVFLFILVALKMGLWMPPSQEEPTTQHQEVSRVSFQRREH